MERAALPWKPVLAMLLAVVAVRCAARHQAVERDAHIASVIWVAPAIDPRLIAYVDEYSGHVSNAMVAPRSCIEAMPLDWIGVDFDEKTPHIAHITCARGLVYVSETVPILVP